MNPRHTLFLLLVLAAVGGYVFFFELNKPVAAPSNIPGLPPARVGSPTPTPVALLGGSPDDLSAISVRTDSWRAVVTRPPGGNWVVAFPVAGEADQLRIAQLAGQLAPLSAMRILTATDQLGVFGLANVTMTLTVNRKDGSSDELSVGDLTPTGDSYYVRSGSSGPVYVVRRAIIDEARRLVTEPPVAKPTGTPVPTSTAFPSVTPASAPSPTRTP